MSDGNTVELAPGIFATSKNLGAVPSTQIAFSYDQAECLFRDRVGIAVWCVDSQLRQMFCISCAEAAEFFKESNTQ